jgi:hypothetical protein
MQVKKCGKKRRVRGGGRGEYGGKEWNGFTFMLPCIVIDFFLNNQPDTLIIPNLFCYKTQHVSGIFSAHHQEFSTVHSALVSSILTLLGSGHEKPA